MSLSRLAAAFGLAGAVTALGGCAAYVSPNGRVDVGVAVPVPVPYVAPRAYYAPPPPVYYRPAPVYVPPVPRYYGPPRPYYGPRPGHW